MNSGAVLLGMTRFIGSVGSRMTYTASGPVTNLAARIASSADNGQVLVGPETARRLAGKISLEDIGEKTFKNVESPVRLFRLASAEYQN